MAQLSNKDFKQIIKDSILSELDDIGIKTLTENHLKTGFFFTKWVHDMIVDYDGGYEFYSEIPEVKDKGVDFVLIDKSNKKVLLAQCKSNSLNKTSSPPANRENVLGFFALHKQIMGDGYLENAPYQTVELLQEYKLWVKEGWNLIFRYITLEKEPSDKLSLDSSKLDSGATKTEEFWGISELKSYWLEANSLSQKPPEEAKFTLKDGSYFEKKGPRSQENVNRTLVGIISGGELANLYAKHRTSLFAYNIRQFLGKPKNKKIIETANEDGDKFFYFNNGITCICSSYKRSGNSIIAKNFQVINGAQTVGSISTASLSEAGIKDVEIMVRITETGEITSTQSGFNRDIVTFNNTQNKVETWDFVSNDDIQQSLEKVLSNNNKAQGFRFQYQRKRISTITAGYKKVHPELLAKLMYSISIGDFNPLIPYGEGKGKLVQNSQTEGGLYDIIFKTDSKKWTNDYLDLAFISIELFYRLDKYFRALKSDEELKIVSNLKFIHIALLKHIIDSKNLSINKLRKNKNDFDKFYDEYAIKVIQSTVMALKKYGDDPNNAGTNINRNFSRSQIEYESLKEATKLYI